MMISVAEAISDLLFVRDTVVVPGLGAFVRKPQSAQVNLETNHFSMPSSQIGFEAGLREDNDVIIKYLVNEIGISENEAKRMLFHFVSDCFNSMKSGQKVQLKDVGTLSFSPENEIVFEQDSTANYNTDAFGLGDFVLEPIVPEKTEVVSQTENEQTTPENVTPDPVEEETPHEEMEEREIGKGVWAFLIALVLIMSGLLYHKVYRPSRVDQEQTASMTTDEDAEPIDPKALVEEMVGGMMGQIIREEPTLPLPVTTSNDTIRIIAGCYDREEPAQRMVNSLKDKGFFNAFMEKRGERWFVAFDRYHTEEEAHEALREIREVKGYKGWILK
ncbi:MAG: SPOR domain-containing protein [Bacteroidales bacterium]|nr:SPOR domain-containing protein [Bacteroidales bacterium]